MEAREQLYRSAMLVEMYACTGIVAFCVLSLLNGPCSQQNEVFGVES